MSRLLTIDQAVKRLGGIYHRESIRQRLRDGRLEGQRVGGPTGKWVLAESELGKLVRLPPETKEQ
jgi:hypothetical protein